MAEIDISNVISVTISDSPISLKQANLSTIALFTTQEGPSADNYYIYRTPNQVAVDWGSTSEVYKQAVAVFAQSPNILTANGYLVVIPMLPSVTIQATSGYCLIEALNLQNFRQVQNGSVNFTADGGNTYNFTGLDFRTCTTVQAVASVFNQAFQNSATSGKAVSGVITVSNFTSVDNGSITITVDGGVPTLISGLDFTDCLDIDDIAEVIDDALTTALGTAVACEANGTALQFTSGSEGATSSILISPSSTGTDLSGSSYLGTMTYTAGVNNIGVSASIVDGQLKFTSSSTGNSSSVLIASNTTGTDLTGIAYLDSSTIIYVQGTSAYSGRERLGDAIIRAQVLVYFNGILVDHDFAGEDEILNASDYVQTQSKMLFLADNALDCCDDGKTFAKIKSRGNTHTRCLAYFGSTIADARLFAAGYASRGLSVDFDGSNTVLSMQLKELASAVPVDTSATETLLLKAKNVGADMYVSVDGVPCVFSHGANDFFDNVYNDIWLKTALQVAGFNLLHTVSSKIPQTVAGVELLVKAYTDVLQTGLKNGAFAPGTWNLATTFGDPQILRDSVASIGYYIYATPIGQQTQSDREERKAPFIQMAIKRAGAIHSSNILVYINN